MHVMYHFMSASSDQILCEMASNFFSPRCKLVPFSFEHFPDQLRLPCKCQLNSYRVDSNEQFSRKQIYLWIELDLPSVIEEPTLLPWLSVHRQLLLKVRVEEIKVRRSLTEE